MHLYYLASTYGSNNFGTCTYDSNGTCATTGAISGGSLVNTGAPVLLYVSIALVIVVVAISLSLFKRKKLPHTK
jgi:hypothetical protein